jgi:hypothetical protein
MRKLELLNPRTVLTISESGQNGIQNLIEENLFLRRGGATADFRIYDCCAESQTQEQDDMARSFWRRRK